VSLTITSTTDTPEQVNQAAVADEGAELIHPAQGESKPEKDEAAPRTVTYAKNIASNDPPEAVQEVQKEFDEDKAERRDQYLGSKRQQKLLKRLSRMHSQVEERDVVIDQLRGRLAQYEPPAQNGDGRQVEFSADRQQQATQRQPQQERQPSYPQQEALEVFRQGEARLPEQVKAAAQKYPDFHESLKNCDANFPVPQVAYLHMVSHVENPAEVAYFLSKNPQAVAKLWALQSSPQPERMLSELDAISYMLRNHGNTPSLRPRATSAAPAPIRPVNGGASTAKSNANPGEMSYQDYKRWHAKKYPDR
jgi:hypothetical protein